MGKLNWNIVESAFSSSSSSTYDLSILVGIDRIAYMVKDENNKVLALREYGLESKNNYLLLKNPLKLTLVNDQLLGLGFKNIRIALSSPASALIPVSLYEHGMERKYLENSLNVNVTDEISSDEIQGFGTRNVYSFDRGILKLLKTYFPKARFYHSGTALLTSMVKLPEFQGATSLFINVVGRQLQIIAIENGDLKFYNSFSYEKTNDFIYYVMMVIDQLGLRAEKVEVTLAGEIMNDSAVYQQLLRYIRNIRFTQKPSFLRFSKDFDKAPGQFFFDLCSINLCA